MNESNKKGICFVTLSNNADHQELVSSMFNALSPDYNVYSIGLTEQKDPSHPRTARNFYFDGPRRPGLTKKTFNFKLINEIADKINSLDVEYVYFESEHIWNAFIMRKLRKGLKKVSSIHDVIPHDNNKSKLLANRVICRMSDYIIIHSSKLKYKLIEMYGVREENVFVVPLWKYYQGFKCFAGNSRNFLFFGRIRKYKGIDALIKIVELCPQLNFTVVGSPDKHSQDEVAVLMSFKNVRVISNEVDNKEMEKYFTNSCCIVLPYASSTQSGVIVDAYKFGRPVVAFDVGAISEQIEENVSGYLIESKNTDLFSKRLDEIAHMNEDDLCRLQKQAYAFGYSKYSVQKNKDFFVQHFLK